MTHTAALEAAGRAVSDEFFNNEDDTDKQMWERIARAALRAFLQSVQPSEAMKLAGADVDVYGDAGWCALGESDALKAWEAMVTALLKELGE